MKCPTCGAENPADARFCGKCGTALAEISAASTPAIPIPPSPPPPSVHGVHLSMVTAAIAAFPIGLLAGVLVRTRFFYYSPYHYYYGAPLPVAVPLIGLALGIVASILLARRFHYSGRSAAAGGMMLLTLGFLFLGIGLSYQGIVPQGNQLNVLLIGIGFALVGLGLGHLYPPSFWRGTRAVTPVIAAVPVAATLVGLVAGWWLMLVLESDFVLLAAGLFALLIGLPAVLISPIVRKARES